MTEQLLAYQNMVKGPGKFEGETAATPYYYELVMNGDGETWMYCDDMDEGVIGADLFEVSADEEELFGLPIGSWVAIREDSQGFAYLHTAATRTELESILDDVFGV